MGSNSKRAIVLLAILAILCVGLFYSQHNRQLQARRDVQQISSQTRPAPKRVPMHAGPVLPEATNSEYPSGQTPRPVQTPSPVPNRAKLRRTPQVRVIEAATSSAPAVATPNSSRSAEKGQNDVINNGMQSNSPPPKVDVNHEQVPSIQPTEDTSSQSDDGRRGALSSAPQSNSSAENSKVETPPEQIAKTSPTESDSIGIASPSPDMGMLHGKGVLNGGTTGEKAIFAGDKIATPSDGFANITVLGSAILLQPQSLVTFNGNSVELERGGLGVTTSNGMTVHVDDITVSPAANGTAKFEVVDNDDTVEVAANVDSVLLRQGGDTTVLPQGQHTTKEKKKKKKATGAVPGSSGAVSEKTAFILLGAGGSTAAVLAILKENSERSTPISPSKP